MIERQTDALQERADMTTAPTTTERASAKATSTDDVTCAAAGIVEAYLEASMIPDPVAAAKFISPDLRITFTGGRVFRHPREATQFNAGRYKWVKKRIQQSDVVRGADDGDTIVYNIGTLYGEWPDGTPFDGNRYVDRFVVRDGLIVDMNVWNDSAERILTMRGITA
jgi:hypothetical protein